MTEISLMQSSFIMKNERGNCQLL